MAWGPDSKLTLQVNYNRKKWWTWTIRESVKNTTWILPVKWAHIHAVLYWTAHSILVVACLTRHAWINCFLLPSSVPFSTLFQKKIILSSLRPEAALEWQSTRSRTPVRVTLKATLGLGALPKLTWAPVRQRTLLVASGFLRTKTNHTGPEKRSVRTDLRAPCHHTDINVNIIYSEGISLHSFQQIQKTLLSKNKHLPLTAAH